jgi:hypothetical protein
MKITDNFKSALAAAKAKGYENVYTVLGAYRATTYCAFFPITVLLEVETGIRVSRDQPDFSSGGRWTGYNNTRQVGKRDISYTEVFKKFGKRKVLPMTQTMASARQ